MEAWGWGESLISLTALGTVVVTSFSGEKGGLCRSQAQNTLGRDRTILEKHRPWEGESESTGI